MSGTRRYGLVEGKRKRTALKRLNDWLRQPHQTGVAGKVMEVVHEGRALLDYVSRRTPQITSVQVEKRSAKLRRIMRRLQFTLALNAVDQNGNGLELALHPAGKDSEDSDLWARGPRFAIPFDARAVLSGDHNAWVALNNIIQFGSEGNFPQRCTAPLPKSAGVCGNWFAKITQNQHACSERCRQRKREATPEYKAEKAKYVKRLRAEDKARQARQLEIAKREKNRNAKKR